jgi:Rieske Fe-S protein
MTASQESAPQRPTPARRTVIAAVGATGLAAALSACGDSSASAGPGTSLVKTSEVPEGGGKVLTDAGVVVTQPRKGEFKAFTDVCTHKQCTVAAVEGGTINCPCHGSRFSVEDGSVRSGPATQPLAEKKIKVTGDSITLA